MHQAADSDPHQLEGNRADAHIQTSVPRGSLSAQNDVFASFSPALRQLIAERGFLSATEPQSEAIPLILAGKNILLMAPTGTGKTEAAFLPILERLYQAENRPRGIKVLYITPLRALNRDLLERLEWWCKRLDIRLGVRHGDTEVRDRGKQALVPPDILITTPETLQAILPGWVMRRHLEEVRWVIVDEIHELVDDKRGCQLSIALERLRYIVGREFQVIGLSATVGSPEAVARFLVGQGRSCEIVRVPVARLLKLQILYPKPEAEDYELAKRILTYPEVAARLRIIRELVQLNKSVLIFTNTRTEAEILASRFRVWDMSFPVGVHHGSLSKPSRVATERSLKDGGLYGVICTSSLEMGIDVGLLELVVQYNSPRQVTRLIQRVGRSGHRVGGVAKGVIITQDADDALEALVISRRAYAEELELVSMHQKPYDVLSHQLAGLMLHKNRWYVDEALSVLRNAYPYEELTSDELADVLSYMNSRYPRLAWFSKNDGIFAKPRSFKSFYDYYFGNLSMIPEEKQYLVLEDGGSPVGVLDEAFVAENGEPGVKFVEAGSVWKIVQIVENKIYVKPEEDPAGAIPTWVGEEIPVPFEVAQEVGSIRRVVEEKLRSGTVLNAIATELSQQYPAEAMTVRRAIAEIEEQANNGIPLPTDRRITIERWGDYVIVNCCFGHLVNRTLSRLVAHMLAEKTGVSVGVHQDPYRIIIRSSSSPRDLASLLLSIPERRIRELTIQAIARTGMFKRRMLHVAKKFGVVSKDADLSGVALSSLIEALKGTVVYDETIKTMLKQDVDVQQTERVLVALKGGEIEVASFEGSETLTPISRIGIEEITRKSDLIPPDRLGKIIVQSVRARILSEGRSIVCTNCWDYVEVITIKGLERKRKCTYCGSEKIGILDQPEEKVKLLCEKVHGSPDRLPRNFRRLYSDAINSSEIYTTYGFAGALVLAGRGVRVSEAKTILEQEPTLSDRLVELVIDAEKRALKRRYFAR